MRDDDRHGASMNPGLIPEQERRPTLPRIGIAAEARYLAQRQPAGLIAALTRAGHPLLFLDPESAAPASLRGLDVVVARGRSAALLDLLGHAEAAGVATVNPRAAVAAVLDKAEMARALAAAGIPSPATRVGALDAIARASRPEDFPMVVKPIFGDNARGVRVVSSRDELARLPWSEPLALAQPFVPSDGDDLKLYVAGASVWAVKKPSPIAQRGGPARLVPATPALEDLAHRCGRLFGLELFGVDCIETPRGPVVIEVNDFPNYTGIDGVNERLARHVVARATACRMERPS
jgi:glutathione synthase/RimK-type ligase-like ATP-grasp enzyme